MSGYDLEDMFLDDVREMIKECENNKNSIEVDKRKLVDIMHRIEKSETEIRETLVKMSKDVYKRQFQRHASTLQKR